VFVNGEQFVNNGKVQKWGRMKKNGMDNVKRKG